ncbi:MAG TPA: PilZ domain-containing protein [Polyangiales bacterium]|nr:PilZ domain-containing protein [Polyangiales bacterium]
MDRGIGLSAAAHGERRHSFRVPLEGRASIWMRNRLLGHYALRDLSIGGCGLTGGPDCVAGAHVELVLHLNERPALWLSAEVRRTQDDQLGLAFERTAARIEDRLQDVVVEVYTRMHADSDHFALVIEPRNYVRASLVERLDALGERALGVATPLDAVQALLENGERVHSVFIGPQRPEMPSYELVEFVARNYPHVRRVLVGDSKQVSEAWLAEATGEVHALLETPCTEDALRRLVQRITTLPQEALS